MQGRPGPLRRLLAVAAAAAGVAGAPVASAADRTVLAIGAHAGDVENSCGKKRVIDALP